MSRSLANVVCCAVFLLWGGSEGYARNVTLKSKPIVNQAGYNLGEAKRFVCYGAEDGISFQIYPKERTTGEPLFTGTIKGFAGDFSDFNPVTEGQEYVILVEGFGQSFPFWIADHLVEKLSSQLAYQFFIDCRISQDPIYSNELPSAGGGPSRDVGAYGLETLFEILQYAANPALYDRWHSDFGDEKVPDLIKLILWHAEFAFHHRDYNGGRGHGEYLIGYPNQEELQEYDYQNTLDHLAAACAAYHAFLKPYLNKHAYYRYRQFTKQNWEKYDRHKEVRFYVYGRKWVALGWHEFNELGNVLGMGVFRNLMMYLCERNEEDGDPERFLNYAVNCAEDVIRTWDFNNPRHMWWIRNGEPLTPQSLAFFLLVAPEHAPKGTKEKLQAWTKHMKAKTDNFWHYRKHSDTEWGHPRSKELGNTGLGGSMFAVAHLIDDPELRALGWSQVNQVFGMNPAEAHYSHKDPRRLKRNGFWDGVEVGWPIRDPGGAGRLGAVRGTLDGTPTDSAFPYPQEPMDTHNVAHSPNHWYTTEGWGLSNRCWQSTVTFATLGSHRLTVWDPERKHQVTKVRPGDRVLVQLRAALNMDATKVETGTLQVYQENTFIKTVNVKETGPNTGLFQALDTIEGKKESRLTYAYGYLGLDTKAVLEVQ